MKIVDGLKTVALFLIAAGLFAMSYVLYDGLGRHGRYTPVDLTEDVVVVMDTHTGQVWSVSYELQEPDSLKTQNFTHGPSRPAAAGPTVRAAR